MGLGYCCNQGVGEYRILGYTGSCSLNWGILNSGENKQQNPEEGFPLDDFHPNGNYNSKFHSDGFNLSQNSNVGIFGYDIMSEKNGKYVYVANGDLGVQVFNNIDGTLILERTISLGLQSRNEDVSLSGGLVIGGTKGSLYGYEMEPFNGAYSLCSSGESRKIYVAAGRAGLYYVDTETGQSSRVRLANDPEVGRNTIFNKVAKFKEFLFIGTTGYTRPANEDLWHQFDENYNNYPGNINPLGVEVLRIDEFETLEERVPISPTSPESLVFKNRISYNIDGRSTGINDLYLMDGDIEGEGDYSIYVATGRVYSEVSTSQDMKHEGGAVRHILSRPIIDNPDDPIEHGKRDFVHLNNSLNFTNPNSSVNWKQPIKSITADSEKIYLTPGTRYAKNQTGTHFVGTKDFADSSEESFTYNNDFQITEIAAPRSGILKNIHNCGDNELLGGLLSWVYSSASNAYKMLSSNFPSPNINDLDETNDNTECFVSDIRRFEQKGLTIASWKGLGVTIIEDGSDKKTFRGLTNKKGTDCSKWKHTNTGFFRSNPLKGYDNFEYTWSPIKSCFSGGYIYFLDSLQTTGNESGPGYFMTWNEDKKLFDNPLLWQNKPSNHQSKIGGVISVRKERF